MSYNTPPPWRIGDQGIAQQNANEVDVIGPLGERIATVHYANRKAGLDNAALVVAAPRLLWALQVMLASAHPNPKEHPTMAPAWELARAVIGEALPDFCADLLHWKLRDPGPGVERCVLCGKPFGKSYAQTVAALDERRSL